MAREGGALAIGEKAKLVVGDAIGLPKRVKTVLSEVSLHLDPQKQEAIRSCKIKQ